MPNPVPVYSDAQREAVFRVWLMQADRFAERTARMVVDDPDCIEAGVTNISAGTVRNWVRAGGWEERGNRELFSGGPGLRFRAQSALVLGSPEAAEFVRKLVNMDESLKVEQTVTSVDKEGIIHVEKVRVFDDKLLALQLKAAMAQLDRTGFSPIGTRDSLAQMLTPPDVQGEVQQQLSEITDEAALREIEAVIRSKAGIGQRR